ncbi:unnamed protein product [Amoebophrya sp. A120]|nr:unnamed protein product [Amoebophrya sp. A120]CAD7975495.1 unnamed protein product [Amoebophrya sp. A120]|eukprot:GSA120T00016367001.1
MYDYPSTSSSSTSKTTYHVYHLLIHMYPLPPPNICFVKKWTSPFFLSTFELPRPLCAFCFHHSHQQHKVDYPRQKYLEFNFSTRKIIEIGVTSAIHGKLNLG